MSTLDKEDLEKAKNNREELTIEIETQKCSHHKSNGKNIFVHIQKIMPIRGNRWMAKGQSFNGIHDVLIFSGINEGRFFAETMKVLRGGLRAKFKSNN